MVEFTFWHDMSDGKPYYMTSSPKGWGKLKIRARDMRHEPTRAEDLLWEGLRGRRLGGAKFRRQHPVAEFIADFMCVEANLVVEIDGRVHDDADRREYDEQRQAWLESLGLTVLRFTNDAVEQDMQAVLRAIRDWLDAAQ